MPRSRRKAKSRPAPVGKAPDKATTGVPEDTALPVSGIRRSVRARLWVIVALGTILRLVIANWGRYLEDSLVLGFRAERLAKLPISDLYKTNQGVIGHLPGDLWILWYISNIFHVLSPNGDFYGETFLYVTKLVPIAGDIGIMCLLFLIAHELIGQRAGLIAAALYAVNPGPIVVASLWDQWDSISMCAALLALWLFLRGRYELTAVALTYAVLIKPQFAILGLLFAVAFAHRHLRPLFTDSRRSGGWPATLKSAAPCARAISAAAAAWVTAAGVLLPFNVAIWPLSAQFDLGDRLRYAFLVHDETTLNAFNLWATPIAGNAINDFEITIAGLTSRTWGQILFGAVVLFAVAVWWRNGTDAGLLWACASIAFAWFMLPTRVHERYMLPTVVFAILLTAIRPRLLWFSAIVTATFAANVIAVYVMAHDQRGAPFFSRHDPWMTLLALINVVAFVSLLAQGLRDLSRDGPGISGAPRRLAKRRKS